MSNQYLLSISVGPVQDFIAQARRTRDLWYGSHLLSELSRAAAKAVADGDGSLIFPPFKKGHHELAECDGPVRGAGNPPAAVANRILAVADSPDKATALARAAREAVTRRWEHLAASIKKRMEEEGVLADDIDGCIDRVWNEQIADTIEYYAAWVPIGRDFGQARRDVESAIAGRKALRDFSPWKHHRERAPKSSLDGARVSVLNDDRKGKGLKGFARLRIGPGEQLDAVGLCKRAGGRPGQFVPLPNLAAAAWLKDASAKKKTEGLLNGLKSACKELKVQRLDRKDLPAATPFPFDASVLYPSRWPTLFEEMGLDSAKAAEWGQKHVHPLLDAMGREPPSYVACLVADGDHMGKALDTVARSGNPVGACRTFSQQLLMFPDQAQGIVANHLGAPVYAGGDDVLAFLPVATALDCAEQLSQAFQEVMSSIGVKKNKPTLSVGIGIAHVVEAMGLLLELGREAERKAKEAGRNALAIVFDKRSGGRRAWSCQWCAGEPAGPPVGRLRRDADHFASKLSSGTVYKAGALLRRFPRPSDSNPATPSGLADALVAYAKQTFAHSGDDGMTPAAIESLGLFPSSTGPSRSYRETCNQLDAGLQRLLLARDLVRNGFGSWSGAGREARR